MGTRPEQSGPCWFCSEEIAPGEAGVALRECFQRLGPGIYRRIREDGLYKYAWVGDIADEEEADGICQLELFPEFALLEIRRTTYHRVQRLDGSPATALIHRACEKEIQRRRTS